jgi:hypothetical protein
MLVLLLFMMYAYVMPSCCMINVILASFVKIYTSVQATLKLSLSNLNGFDFGITDVNE